MLLNAVLILGLVVGFLVVIHLVAPKVEIKLERNRG